MFIFLGFPGRMGNNKQALQLIIQEEKDVEKVFSVCSVLLDTFYNKPKLVATMCGQ